MRGGLGGRLSPKDRSTGLSEKTSEKAGATGAVSEPGTATFRWMAPAEDETVSPTDSGDLGGLGDRSPADVSDLLAAPGGDPADSDRRASSISRESSRTSGTTGPRRAGGASTDRSSIVLAGLSERTSGGIAADGAEAAST
jgi:hypothetical protein